jgi:hypothetical protein
MTQVRGLQCSNCGGHKVYDTIHYEKVRRQPSDDGQIRAL